MFVLSRNATVYNYPLKSMSLWLFFCEEKGGPQEEEIDAKTIKIKKDNKHNKDNDDDYNNDDNKNKNKKK